MDDDAIRSGAALYLLQMLIGELAATGAIDGAAFLDSVRGMEDRQHGKPDLSSMYALARVTAESVIDGVP